jgi:glucose-6-phosphate 1-dehydrogenase
MAEFIPVPEFELVVFGASGDLALRKLYPSLFHRFCDGQISNKCRIIGVARHELSRDEFIASVTNGFVNLAGGKADDPKFIEFTNLLEYVALDATSAQSDWSALKNFLCPDEAKVRVFYLSTPPAVFGAICQALKGAGLASAQSRVVLEKPLGRDLQSATAIHDAVGEVFSEDRVYRIDHYLGKETVQNLLVLRFANALFEPIWSRNGIDHIEITVAEDIGVGSRGDYYDKSGAMRDMVQNHLLQLLCLVAMEPPSNIEADAIRTEKIKVLRALEPIGEKEINDMSVRGQYKAGLINNAPVKSYLEELQKEGAPPPTSTTETFVALKAFVNNWRWAGVPFYLRTGKRLAKRKSEIVVHFRTPPHHLFEGDYTTNKLVMRLQPDEGMEMWLQIKEPGPGGLRVKSVPLDLSYAETFTLRYPDAYERLLMDVVRGNLSLFMRRDEVEAAWVWVDRIIGAWESQKIVPHNYTSGSDGPLASALMMDRDGRNWSEI